ncbi:ethanolamine ammonia-lyase reactivating factor EutA [Marinobacter sp.]|uniref:ethanolamine ammonia-lyase reactivating factor EutA n=1 Tax=Marinobacter sp. TaxID=50741 RepID=UPI003A933B1D
MATKSPQILQSVGIDIGTSTMQLVFSRLTLKNIAPGSLVPKFAITDKEVYYKSEIHTTPIDTHSRLDIDKIFELIQSEFDGAAISPKDIDTGAVIITGETARNENARSISARVAEFSGNFVVATAGGKLEAIIAGKGSGAADLSRREFSIVANVDIGGGTSNIGVFKNGKAIDSCCFNVGGRMLQVDQVSSRITAVSEPMLLVLSDLNLELRKGDSVSLDDLRRICQRMSKVVLECLGVIEPSTLATKLLVTAPLRLNYKIDSFMISGGVADHVYSPRPTMTLQEATQYNDLGPLLGNELANLSQAKKIPLVKPLETIRATVIGAGAQTVDVSGSTILVDEQLLPFKNIPVAIPFVDLIPKDETTIARQVAQSISSFYESNALEKIAIGLLGEQHFSFKEIQVLARGLLQGLEPLIRKTLPVIVVLESDIGKVLGQTMRSINNQLNIVCLDQLVVAEGDYIDIGKPLASGTVVPVVIKSLVFETKQVE